jgi:general secretion pathway protein A
MNEREVATALKKIWGASQMPFATANMPRGDYQSAQQKAVEEQWRRWVELGASGLVWGDHGLGKTVLLQRVREALSPKLYSVIVLTHTSLSAGDILCALCDILGQEPAFRRSRTAKTLLNLWQRDGRKPVLLVDEAQNLSATALEELRMLMCVSAQSNTGQGREPLILSLCGDRELLPKLRLGINAPLLSRLGYQLALEPFSEPEVETYLETAFAQVGVSSLPLETGVVPLIHRACDGNPRKVNHLLVQAILLLLQETNNNNNSMRISPTHIQNAIAKIPSLTLKKHSLP